MRLAAYGIGRMDVCSVTISGYARDALGLVQMYDANIASVRARQQNLGRLPHGGPRSCNWYVPNMGSVAYGGARTILRCAAFCRREGGMAQRFIVCEPCNIEDYRARLVEAFPDLWDADVLSISDWRQLDEVPYADVSICTLWTTAYALLRVNNTAAKCYFVQDYEPLFYPAGTVSALADETYRFGFYVIANSVGLWEWLRGRFGCEGVYFTPQVDRDVFHPPVPDGRERSSPRVVWFYARPNHPRNAFELAVSALARVKERLGNSVRIVAAGDGFDPGEFGVGGIVDNLGMLEYAETGELYRKVHIGVSLMMTMHPSYIPLELMACGALVIGNRNPANGWLLEDGRNAVLVPALTVGALAETVVRTCDAYEEMGCVRQTACDEVAHRYSDWDREMARVLRFFQGLGRGRV